MAFRLFVRFVDRVFIGLLFAVLFMQVSAAQDPANPPAPEPNSRINLYLDCNRCDSEYIRQEVTYINYVRDRQDADIHLLITTQTTGSGGTEYLLNFLSTGLFANTGTILTFSSSGTDTRDQRREGLKRTIEMGLMPALSQTPLWRNFRLGIEQGREGPEIPVVDPWKDWVFRIGVNGEIEGEQSQRTYEVGGNFSATKLSELWKVRVSFNGDYEERQFDIDDSTHTFTQRDGTISGLIARSLGDHWSVGVFGEANTSSFENTNLSMEFSPAIEYNLFPYSESSRREFRFTYRVNLRSFEYEELTILGETAEIRLHHSLGASYDIKQPWGSIDLSITGSQYLHDLGKYRVDLFTRIDFQIIRGLSFNVFGRVSRTQDQLYLSAEELDDTDIIVGFTDLATEWDYSLRAGVSYRFGSIFNNVVNSRFGSRGGGGGFRF